MLAQTKMKWQVMVIMLGVIFMWVASAQAHSRTELEDDIVVIVGWVEEPPLVGERNAILVEVSQNETPLEKVEATLDAELMYAGKLFSANLNPTDDPGIYHIPIIPTVRGQFETRLYGTINGLDVDVVTFPEEVFPASRLQFPDAEKSGVELEQQITDLEAQLSTARLIAIIGVVIGIISLIMQLLKKRQASK